MHDAPLLLRRFDDLPAVDGMEVAQKRHARRGVVTFDSAVEGGEERERIDVYKRQVYNRYSRTVVS